MSEAEQDRPAPIDDSDQPPPAPPEPAPPVRSEGQLWLEVAAVLAVGVVPSFVFAAGHLVAPQPVAPYWLSSVTLAVTSLCTSFVVLYLIARSGESWQSFGITRPGWVDLPLALVVVTLTQPVVLILWLWMPHPDTKPPPAYASPSGGLDLVWLVVMDAANALAEELVTRAYLITRLVRLMESHFQAVVLSALLFASYHIYQGPDGSLNAFFFGLLYGVFFLALRRVWPLALAHMLHNVFWELADAVRLAGP